MVVADLVTDDHRQLGVAPGDSGHAVIDARPLAGQHPGIGLIAGEGLDLRSIRVLAPGARDARGHRPGLRAIGPVGGAGLPSRMRSQVSGPSRSIASFEAKGSPTPAGSQAAEAGRRMKALLQQTIGRPGRSFPTGGQAKGLVMRTPRMVWPFAKSSE